MDQIYNESYFSGAEYVNYIADRAVHDSNSARKWSLLKSYFRSSSDYLPIQDEISVLELGCAHGFFLDYLRRQNVKSLFGLDVSHSAIEYAQKNHGTFFSAERVPDNFKYNCLVMWDLWEHLEKPLNTLHRYAEPLPAGALVALTTVDASSVLARLRGSAWRQLHPPSHLHYPTGPALRSTFEKMSFEVVVQSYFPVARSLETYLKAAGVPCDNWPENILRIPLRLNTYDTQILIARKK